MKHKDREIDVAIMGAGFAGISAALWCSRMGLDHAVFEISDRIGGQILYIEEGIPDLAGFEGTGSELVEVLHGQIRNRGIPLHLNTDAGIDPINRTLRIPGEPGFQWKRMIWAAGLKKRVLSVAPPGTAGVCYSKSDLPQHGQNETVFIVGGGDGAFENALILAKRGFRVIMILRRNVYRAQKQFVISAFTDDRIEILENTIIVDFLHTEEFTGVHLKREDVEWKIPGKYLLVKIGFEPQTDGIREFVELDEQGYILCDPHQRTDHPAIFTAGDVCNPVDPSLSTASGQACLAVREIERELRQ